MSHNIHSYTSRRSTIEDVQGLGAVTKGFGCDISVGKHVAPKDEAAGQVMINSA